MKSIEPVKPEEKQEWYSVAFVWIGAALSMSGIVSGAALAQTNSFWWSIIAGVIGYTIIIVISMFQGMQGSDTGLPTAVASREVFGEKGSRYIFSTILAVALIGWFGIQGGVVGSTLQEYFNTIGINLSLNMWTIIAGVLMTLTAMFGIKSMKYLNYVAVPFMILVLLWATYGAFSQNSVTLLINYQPPTIGSPLSAISAIVGGFIVGATIASDYTRYCRTRKDTLKATFFGIVPIGLFLKILGVVLAIFFFSNNPGSELNVYQIISSYVPSPFIVFLMILLAAWTTNVGNSYSGGLAIANGFNLNEQKHKYAILIAGVLGTLLAVVGILNMIIGFLSFLTALVAPIAGVMIADYWILNKGSKKEETPKLHSVAIGSWFVGCVPYILCTLITTFVSDSTALYTSAAYLSQYTQLVGVLISMLVYVLVAKTINVKNTEVVTAK